MRSHKFERRGDEGWLRGHSHRRGAQRAGRGGLSRPRRAKDGGARGPSQGRGAATTDAPWREAPEFNVTTYSYVMSLMPRRVIDELRLEHHGYKVYPMGPSYYA